MPGRDKFLYGLDIGSHSIKLVKLKALKEGLQLCAFYCEPTGKNTLESLNKIRELSGAGTANISISGPAVLLRYVNFPKMSESEMKHALKFEAQKHIPFSLSDVYLDGFILKEGLAENKMLILIAAAKKDLIQERARLLGNAGIRPNIIEADSISLVNAFSFNYGADDGLKNKTIALINIGASLTNLNIIESGVPRLSRDIQIAGSALTQKLCDSLGMGFLQAEELKVNPDKEKIGAVSSAVEPALSNLASEIRTSFDYYESQNASSVAKIYLSGGSSSLSGIKEALSGFLGIEAQEWDALKNLSLSAEVDAQKARALSGTLPVAIGLALRQ